LEGWSVTAHHLGCTLSISISQECISLSLPPYISETERLTHSLLDEGLKPTYFQGRETKPTTYYSPPQFSSSIQVTKILDQCLSSSQIRVRRNFRVLRHTYIKAGRARTTPLFRFSNGSTTMSAMSAQSHEQTNDCPVRMKHLVTCIIRYLVLCLRA
jgi:hypothetical protein